MFDRFFPDRYIEPNQCKKAYKNPHIKYNVTPVDLVFEKSIIIPDADCDIDRHPEHQEGDRCNESLEKFSY